MANHDYYYGYMPFDAEMGNLLAFQKGYDPFQNSKSPSSMNPYLASAQIAMMAAAPIAGQIAGQDTRPQILGGAPNPPSGGAYGSNFNYQPLSPYGGRNKDAMYRSLLARYLMGR